MIAKYLTINNHFFLPRHPLRKRVVGFTEDGFILANTCDSTDFDPKPSPPQPSITQVHNAGIKLPKLGGLPMNGIQAAAFERSAFNQFRDSVVKAVDVVSKPEIVENSNTQTNE